MNACLCSPPLPVTNTVLPSSPQNDRQFPTCNSLCLLPLGLCMCCSFYMEYVPSSPAFLQNSASSFRIVLRHHFSRKVPGIPMGPLLPPVTVPAALVWPPCISAPSLDWELLQRQRWRSLALSKRPSPEEGFKEY